MKRTSKKRLFGIAIGFFGIICLVTAICYAVVSLNAEGKTFDKTEEIPYNTYGLLLGTSIYTPFGDPNPYFINRVDAAAKLYKAGKIRYLICSGATYKYNDDGTPKRLGCDELRSMHDSLIVRGVPDSIITLDYEGLRTLNSVMKVHDVYGIDSITVISQKFHNERAIYQADKIGLQAIGFNAEHSPVWWHRGKTMFRELGARVKLFIDFTPNIKP